MIWHEVVSDVATVGCLLLVIGMGVVVMVAVEYAKAERQQARQRRFERQLRQQMWLAEYQIDRAHRRARCRMNETSGQGWRNLAE